MKEVGKFYNIRCKYTSNKKSQAAMEFLMTYGWAILIVLIAIAALTLLLDPMNMCLPQFQLSSPILHATEHQITGINTAVSQSKNLFYIIFQNSQAAPIKITEVSVSRGGVMCGSVSGLDIDLKQDEKTNIILARLNNSICEGQVNSCYKLDTSVSYVNTEGYLPHTIQGKVGGTYHPGGSLWALGGPWMSKLMVDNTINMDNKNGLRLNVCSPESPPSPATLTDTVPSGIIFWNYPTSCSNSFSQIGFSNACTSTVPALRRQWLHNTLYIDSVFSSYTFYLGGNGQYYDDSDGGQLKTNGICLNDNMYIYINSALRYTGGTTGRRISTLNMHYVTGDEIIKGCGGDCASVDSSAWCMPALKLNTAGFNFGQNNNLDILVEDYCGGGPPHAGGMSDLNLQIV
jgi:hypothetical protein